jgi:hypothetical protein
MEHVLNMKAELDQETPLSFLVLENPAVKELTQTEGFSPQNISCSIKLNGLDFSPEDLNKVLYDWQERITDKIKARLAFDQTQEGVTFRAETLLKDKLGVAQEVLEDIERLSWKLQE